MFNVIKTLPRDCRLVSRHVKSLLELRGIEKSGGSIGSEFDKIADKYPDKPAFLFKDQVWTFKQVKERSNRIGNLFSQAGLKKSDKVSLFMENRPEYICTWLGLCKIGVVTALVNFNLRSEFLKHSFKLADGKAIICGYELADAFNEIHKNLEIKVPVFGTGMGDRDTLKFSIDLDKEMQSHSNCTPKEQEGTGYLDELFYLYTSGTTGFSKASIIKQCRFFMGAVAGKNANDLRSDDIIYATLPLYHTNCGVLAASQILNGITIAIREKFSASNFWTDCVKHNATVAMYMGETMRYLLRQPIIPEEKEHKVRAMLGNGLRAEIWKEFVERFGIKQISEIYGSTEGNVSTVNYENKVGACGFIPISLIGKIFPMTIIKLDSEGNPVRDSSTGLLQKCQPLEIGELVGKIETDHPFRDFKGYAANKAANANKILNDVFQKGDSVFRTGDLFIKDELGFLYFKDRMGETYRWKGENVSTTEVEYLISNLTSKKLDVVLFPVKIPNTDGQAGMAVIADQDKSLDLSQLSGNIQKSLPSYAIPIFLRIVDKIEMTGTHKMKKTDLQSEGWDITKVKDNSIYFWSNKKYIPLTKDLNKKIMAGIIKL